MDHRRNRRRRRRRGCVASGATAAEPAEGRARQVPQVLAAKLGQELNKPADDVLAALKAAPKPAKREKPTTKEQRRRGGGRTKVPSRTGRRRWVSR